jgi:hypothetical protein
VHSNLRELLYGCQDGRLVQLLVDAGTVRQGFVTPGQSSSGSVRAAVTAIHCGADYSKVNLLNMCPVAVLRSLYLPMACTALKNVRKHLLP